MTDGSLEQLLTTQDVQAALDSFGKTFAERLDAIIKDSSARYEEALGNLDNEIAQYDGRIGELMRDARKMIGSGKSYEEKSSSVGYTLRKIREIQQHSDVSAEDLKGTVMRIEDALQMNYGISELRAARDVLRHVNAETIVTSAEMRRDFSYRFGRAINTLNATSIGCEEGIQWGRELNNYTELFEANRYFIQGTKFLKEDKFEAAQGQFDKARESAGFGGYDMGAVIRSAYGKRVAQ